MNKQVPDFSKNVAREQNFPEKVPVATFVNKYDLEVMET